MKKVGTSGYVVSLDWCSAFRPKLDEARAALQEELGDVFPHEKVDRFMDAYSRLQAKCPSP